METQLKLIPASEHPNYVADSNIKGINPDTIMGHHGVGIFWNVADWTIE